jgi:hemerythrin-like metal-binding protein
MNAREDFPLEWSDAMSVGDYSVDNQHKSLLMICRRCEKLQRDASADGVELFHEQLHELQNYAQVHFRAEEALLARIAYPELEKQKQEHLKYQDDLTELIYEAVIGNVRRSSVVQFLSDWWIDHILVSDMQYVPYLASFNNLIRRDSRRANAVLNTDNCRRFA